MDIEGGELEVMDEILSSFQGFLPFAQLHLEGDQNGSLFPAVYKLWEDLEGRGMRPFSNEINHWPCVRAQLNPIYIEYSFINIHPGVKQWSRLLP